MLGAGRVAELLGRGPLGWPGRHTPGWALTAVQCSAGVQTLPACLPACTPMQAAYTLGPPPPLFGWRPCDITASEYEEVLAYTLLPEGWQLFGKGCMSTGYYSRVMTPHHRGAGRTIRKRAKGHAGHASCWASGPPTALT